MKYLTKVNSEKNILEIYTIKPKNEKIKKYKENELAKIPYDERIMFACSGYVEGYSEGVPRYCDSIQKEKAPIIVRGGNSIACAVTENISKYTDFVSVRNHKLLGALINLSANWEDYGTRVNENTRKYIKGEFNNCPAKMIRYAQSDEREYYIVTTDYKWTSRCERYILEYMHNLVKLTPELYKLHCLETDDFEVLINENVDEQLKLFETKLVGSIDLNTIKDLETYNIIPNALSLVMKKTLNG